MSQRLVSCPRFHQPDSQAELRPYKKDMAQFAGCRLRETYGQDMVLGLRLHFVPQPETMACPYMRTGVGAGRHYESSL